MGSFSDFLEREMLDHVLPTSLAYTRATNIFCALFTAEPSDSGGGTEVATGSYARVTSDAWNVATTSAGGTTTSDNSSAISFPQATADWNTVTAFGIFDTSTGGNLLLWSSLTTDRIVLNGDTASFSAGALDVTLD